MQTDVHRDHGHSRLDRGENRLEPLRAVGYEQGHAVAGLPAEAEERLCEAADSCRRLAKRHDPSRIHPGWAVSVSLSGAWQEAARIHSRLVKYSIVDNGGYSSHNPTGGQRDGLLARTSRSRKHPSMRTGNGSWSWPRKAGCPRSTRVGTTWTPAASYSVELTTKLLTRGRPRYLYFDQAR